MYFKKNLRILVNGQAMATWPDALKIAKMAKNSHLWTHWSVCLSAVLAALPCAVTFYYFRNKICHASPFLEKMHELK